MAKVRRSCTSACCTSECKKKKVQETTPEETKEGDSNLKHQEETEHEWFYIDSSATQHGPLSKAEIVQQIHSGQIEVVSHGWREGIEEWKPLSEMPEFASLFPPTAKPVTSDSTDASTAEETIPDTEKQWMYLDKNKKQLGPVSTLELIELYMKFEVRDATLVWKPGVKDWTRLSEMEELEGRLGLQPLNPTTPATPAVPVKEPSSAEVEAKKEKNKKKRERKKAEKWKATADHSNVYFQGLPTDITAEELHAFAKRAGIVKEDTSGQYKIKLYKDKDGNLKGDALVCYLRENSVQLAEQLLDGAEIRPGKAVKAQKAAFEMKGDKFEAKKKQKAEKSDIVKKSMSKKSQNIYLGQKMAKMRLQLAA